MAGFDYAKSQRTVEGLITKFGQVAAIRRSIPGTGPARNPGPPTFEYHRVKIAVLGYDKREVDGTNILATDKRLYVSPIGFTLEVNPTSDVVITGGIWSGAVYVGGQALRIIPPVNQLNPAGTVVYWDLQARI